MQRAIFIAREIEVALDRNVERRRIGGNERSWSEIHGPLVEAERRESKAAR